MSDTALGPMGSVPIDVRSDAFIFPQSGRVDGHKRFIIHLKTHIDTIASCPRHLRNDHPIALGQSVDERAFANIASSHNRNFHLRFRKFIALRYHLGNFGGDGLNQIISPEAIGRRNFDRHPIPKSSEFFGSDIELVSVTLVGHQQQRLIGRSQTLADRLVKGRHTIASIDNEQKKVRLLDTELNLLFDFVGKVIHIIDADSTRIDQLKIMIILGQHVRHAITGHASHVIDDSKPSANQPIEEARLAHIGASNYRNLGE